MARKKAVKKQETALVLHKRADLDLNALLSKAVLGNSVMAVQDYLDAGGSATAVVKQFFCRELPQPTLLHAVVRSSAHTHAQLASCVRVLGAAGADLNAASIDYMGHDRTALMCAAERSCCSKPVHILLQNGADARVRSKADGATALHRAAVTGQIKNCEVLAAAAESAVHTRDREGSTPLALAAEYGHTAVVELLHRRYSADLRLKKTSDGDTPLHLGARSGHLAVMSYLIKHGADLNAVNSNKLSVVAIAAYADSVSAVKLLLSHGADPAQTDIRGMNALYAAVVSGNVAILKVLQQHGDMSLITPQQQHIEGRSLLMVAAAEGQRAAVVWLLNQCPELATLADSRRSTPLHAAAVCNEPEIIELLIAAGADMHARDSDGETALDSTLLCGQPLGLV
jgi:ankyrin repeat protein